MKKSLAGFAKEFKEFILRGNVLNLAVGIIIGASFQGIVTSLTDNIISPLLGLITRQNFDTLSVSVLGTEIRYGAFITSVLNFIIMAFVVFLLVKGMTKVMSIHIHKPAPAPEPEPTTKTCPFCMSEINIKAVKCPACTADLG